MTGQDELKKKLLDLATEHRDLDNAIAALTGPPRQLPPPEDP